MADVIGGLVGAHAGHVVADGDALVEGGHDAVADLGSEVGLAEQDGGERGAGIELVVGELGRVLIRGARRPVCHEDE